MGSVLFSNVKKDINGEQVHWLKIKQLRFEKARPTEIQFKYNLDEEFRVIQASVAGRRRSSDKVRTERKPLYNAPLTISSKKLADLINLCETRIIPSCYHGYYKQLKGTVNEE